ncbi:MAG: efflux RND transporter periplasmic adaptor subunit [Planctomycetes bacterium]|nr:efflux RND transporter periplasmic adaptor subunit [Planctomycetota bacterium]
MTTKIRSKESPEKAGTTVQPATRPSQADKRQGGSGSPLGSVWLKLATGIVVVLLVILFFVQGGSQPVSAATVPETQKRPVTMVLLTEAREMAFNESVSSDGSIKTRFYSLVSPRIVGTIDDIFVREGDLVEADKTTLFQIDSLKLQQSVDLAKQSLVIAESTLDERRANLVKAQADLSQAEKDFARTKSLYEQKVVPLSEYEVGETKVVQLQAQLKVAETQLTLAEQNVTLSKISLAMAEKDFRDSTSVSPFDGVVSGRYAEPGEMGSPGASILRIDDTRQLKAVAYLPGQFYPRINVGDSVMQLTVLDKVIGEFPITYKAPAIDSALRTFEIWADVPGDGSYVVPGAQCVIKVILRETTGIGVPRDAVQFRDGKYWIFVPDGDVAKMVEVKPGMETGGWTELLDSPIQPGDKVVTQGQFLLNDGNPIRERTIG